MSSIDTAIEVDVPVRTAYNQWTQFEEFPRFMEGVREVRQLDDQQLDWRAEIGGKEKSGAPRSPSRFPTRGSPGRARPAPAMPAS